MSDLPSAETPTPKPVTEDGKVRSGAGARRLRQVQARLDKCIRDGQVPPFCENCGSIETPTWRRAWSKEFVGGEADANERMKDPTMLFWRVSEKNDKDEVTKFKMYKKSLVDADNDFVQILLCNRKSRGCFSPLELLLTYRKPVVFGCTNSGVCDLRTDGTSRPAVRRSECRGIAREEVRSRTMAPWQKYTPNPSPQSRLDPPPEHLMPRRLQKRIPRAQIMAMRMTTIEPMTTTFKKCHPSGVVPIALSHDGRRTRQKSGGRSKMQRKLCGGLSSPAQPEPLRNALVRRLMRTA
jgi:hypothetical protein